MSGVLLHDVGEPHAGCTRHGVLCITIERRWTGEWAETSTRRVPVMIEFLSFLTCDGCRAQYLARDAGKNLVDYCRGLVPNYRPLSVEPAVCPYCSGEDGKNTRLRSVILPVVPGIAAESGSLPSSVKLCLRCGHLLWVSFS
jgi:hypothetical protein